MQSTSEYLASIETLIMRHFGVVSVGEPIMGVQPLEEAESTETRAYRFELLQLEPSQLAEKLNALVDPHSPVVGPKLQPDYEFWTSCPFWTHEQATALAFGKNPARGHSSDLDCLWQSPGPSTLEADGFLKALKAIKLAQLTGRLSDPIDPKTFLAWAKETNLILVNEFTAALETMGARLVNEAKLPGSTHVSVNQKTKVSKADADRQLSGKELVSVAKMVFVMSKKFGFKSDKRNSAAKNIADRAKEADLSLDDDTVHKYLMLMSNIVDEDGILETPKPNSV